MMLLCQEPPAHVGGHVRHSLHTGKVHHLVPNTSSLLRNFVVLRVL